MSSGREEASQRIGLDYLIESEKVKGGRGRSAEEIDTTTDSDQLVDSNLQAFAGRTVLETIKSLEDDPGKGVRLSKVAEATGMSAVVLVPLTQRLEKLELLKVLDRTSFGDHCVGLTPLARRFLEVDEVGLMERLGLT